MMTQDESHMEGNGKTALARMRLVPLAALLLILVTASHASAACDSARTFDLSNWKVLTAAAIMISFGLIGLMYMFGKLMDNDRLINMAKTDIQQTIITAVLVYVLFMPLVLGICSLNLSFLGFSSDMSIFDASRNYFEYSKQVALNKFQEAMDKSMLIGFVSSIYLGQGFSINYMSISYSPFAGLSVLSAITSSIMNWLLLNIAVADAQRVLVDVIQTSFLNLLLPAGVVLRALSPTRNVGGILISISIGLFLIHPLVFALSYAMIGAPPVPAAQAPQSFLPVVGEYLGAITGMVMAANLLKASSILVQGVMLVTIWPWVVNSTISTVISIMGSLGDVLFVVLVLPGLAWIYITAFVRDVSKLMGEEIDISSLSRMI